ncbi:MAG TPA: hypothetical protein DEA90_03010 [Opitutae bacterium]|nr:hypothetical protein [Puniceicoccaceae bacterium]HBR93114.1 hypothetical protein [Opitutae bacterium]|tara:strand:+ start:404 stop:883 length:480 start_codon:yes stop_codon:yes gene_type:complete
MKFFFHTLLVLLSSLSLCAQEEPVELPTEVSEPPYELGDLVTEQGYYVDRGEEEPRINLRIVDNRLRLYWIDENGLIAEPETETATVRFTGVVRGRSYHHLKLLPDGFGLGAPGILPPPHLYNVILVLPAVDGEEPVSYSFRYQPSMDTEVDPTTDSDS